jgi:TMEM199 family protein
MVLLTMTTAVVAALNEQPPPTTGANDIETGLPSLAEPALGKPIAHSQIIDLWRRCGKADGSNIDYSLEKLLQGSQVYIPPPPPKPEPVGNNPSLTP